MIMNFIDETKALYGQYDKNLKVLQDESTVVIFKHILKEHNNQIHPITISNIQIGKFYIIKYNFNGNKLWCPILTIPPIPNKNEAGLLDMQLKISGLKKIIYAINFDYLPTKYKISFIDYIINSNNDKYELNKNKIESGLKAIDEYKFDLNWVYNFLRINGEKNYSITAYDISKIENVFAISSTVLHRFVFLDTYYINNRLMYDTLENINTDKLKNEFGKKIKIYESILELYYKDIEIFYKSLRNFEKNLKLIEDL